MNNFALVTTINFITILAGLLQLLILARIVMSWFVRSENKFVVFIWSSTEPILGLFRRLIPRVGLFDFSPLVAYLVLDILRYIVVLGLSNFLPL